MSFIESNDRKKPFSSLEKNLFLNVIQNYNEILTSKKTNASSILQKKNCWEQIKYQFNSSSIVTQKEQNQPITFTVDDSALHASTKQLIKLWYNMKAKARESKTKENVRFLTGGGPSVSDIDPVDAKVMDIDKNILTNIEVDIDSDITGSIEVTGDENDEAWRKLTPGIECSILADETIPSVSPTQPKKPQSSFTSKTPSKKRNDKYLNNVDAYKIKILEEELEFKKKLHEEELEIKKMERAYREKLFQLEIEIKKEELNKLKNK